jgi:hypothetical protein
MSHTPRELLVTLANGTQVPWTEFRTWSASKQAGSVRSSEANNKIRQAASRTHKARDWSETHRANHRKAMDAMRGLPSPHAGKPGRKWTEEQKQAHAIRQQLIHLAGLRRSNLGRKASEETRARQREAALNRQGPGNNAKAVHTPFGVFDSVKIAAEKLGVAYCTIGRRMIKDPNNYYFV